MKTSTLAALLWWVAYCGSDDAFEGPGTKLEYIESNFAEWTDSAKERNRFRRIAASMKTQSKANHSISAETKPELTLKKKKRKRS